MAREQLRVCWASCSGRQDAKGKAPVVPTLRLLAKAEWASLPQRLIFPFPCQPCVRSKRNSFRPSAPSADFHWARHPGLSSAVVAPSRGVLQSEVHGCSRSGSSLGASVFASAMVIVRFVNSAEAEQVQSGLPNCQNQTRRIEHDDDGGLFNWHESYWRVALESRSPSASQSGFLPVNLACTRRTTLSGIRNVVYSRFAVPSVRLRTPAGRDTLKTLGSLANRSRIKSSETPQRLASCGALA